MSSQFQCKSDIALSVLCLSASVTTLFSSAKLFGNICWVDSKQKCFQDAS